MHDHDRDGRQATTCRSGRPNRLSSAARPPGRRLRCKRRCVRLGARARRQPSEDAPLARLSPRIAAGRQGALGSARQGRDGHAEHRWRQRPILCAGSARSTRLAILQGFAAGCQARYHGVLVPEVALFTTERSEFLLLGACTDDAATLHYRFLNRRVSCRSIRSWAEWLWERALRLARHGRWSRVGWRRIAASPTRPHSQSDLTAAIRRGALRLADDRAIARQITLPKRPIHWSGLRMARLESVARAGYYPTPPRVAAILARHSQPSTGSGGASIRLLDPCAGTGEAAAVLAQSSWAPRASASR